MNRAGARIYVALDTADTGEAQAMARRLKGAVAGVKLGLEFFTANGPGGVRTVAKAGLPVFLDLKFHDIPNTVAGAVTAAAALRPGILTVHAGGGAEMMRAAAAAAAEAAAKAKAPKPLVVGVTVLTSLDDGDLEKVGQRGPAGEQAVRLAMLAKESGLDGIVCSPKESAAIRSACGPEFTLVVPGIRPSLGRPALARSDDQKRVAGPGEVSTADVLVIGRPITRAPDPAAAARAMAAALGT